MQYPVHVTSKIGESDEKEVGPTHLFSDTSLSLSIAASSRDG